MSHVALTGGDGFLGWHTFVAMQETGLTGEHIPVGDSFDVKQATQAVSGAGRFIHLAGVNRGTDDEVLDGNLLFARQMAQALRQADQPPAVVVYSNSIQATNGSIYGNAKLEAADILAQAASDIHADFVDIRFPNLFGEHGRPFYNAVTSTFCHILAEGGEPRVVDDKELTLLHAQNAADLLLGYRHPDDIDRLSVVESVSGLLSSLASIANIYRTGQIPDIANGFDRDLFNTYRSYTFTTQTPIHLMRHADQRGSFFEIIRSSGGAGQSSFSTTVPGISRGDHYHRRKVERFTVLSGQATISLRKLLTHEVFDFPVNGEEPVAIDMPTGWAHRITNTGSETLFTSFWANELFDPEAPDTIPEVV